MADKKTCPDCNGSGEAPFETKKIGNMNIAIAQLDELPKPNCETCGGSGEVDDILDEIATYEDNE